MKTTLKKISDTRIEIKVTLEKEDLEIAKKKALERLSKEVKVEGFRKGKAPLELAEKLIPDNELQQNALDIAVRTSVPKAFQENSKRPLVIPNVNVTKFVPNELAEYTATADILPEIKLGNYKNLKVKREKIPVKESDITEILENIRAAYAEKKVEKKKAELGDEVIIDFVGKKDGTPFKGGTAKNFPLTLGSKSLIPGFEEGVVDKESGDKFDLNLTFPKDYHEKSLAGEKVTFEILVKQVNVIKKPELNNEFAKKCGPFKTVDELKADIKKNLEAQNNHKFEEKYKDDLVDALVKASKVSAPEILISDQLRFIEDDISRNAASQGLKFEDYLSQINKTEDEWKKEARKLAEKRVLASLVLQVLANEEKITVSDEDVTAKITELRDVYKKSPEALKNLKDPRVKMDVKNRMTIEKTLDFLIKANER